jgi:hypothetical protein
MASLHKTAKQIVEKHGGSEFQLAQNDKEAGRERTLVRSKERALCRIDVSRRKSWPTDVW